MNKRTKLSASIILSCILVAAGLLILPPGVRRHQIRNQSGEQAQYLTWEGCPPRSRDTMVIQAIKETEPGYSDGRVMVRVLTKTEGKQRLIVRNRWRSQWMVSEVIDLQVFPNTKHKELNVVMHVGGPRLIGVIVLGVSNSGEIRTLYADTNWGGPHIQKSRGKLEVVEVWPIHRLEQMGWKPTQKFQGHTLIKRIYQPDKTGVYKIVSIEVAKEEEAKLSPISRE